MIWTNDNTDQLLQAWFRNTPINDVATLLGTVSHNSIESQLWKLAVRYPTPSVLDYRPSTFRDNREGTHFTVKDNVILELSVGVTGTRHDAHNVDHLSRILYRTEQSIQTYMENLAGRGGGLLTRKPRGESNWQWTISRVRRALRGNYSRMRRMYES